MQKSIERYHERERETMVDNSNEHEQYMEVSVLLNYFHCFLLCASDNNQE